LVGEKQSMEKEEACGKGLKIGEETLEIVHIFWMDKPLCSK
jgi:hypothetical protein